MTRSRSVCPQTTSAQGTVLFIRRSYGPRGIVCPTTEYDKVWRGMKKCEEVLAPVVNTESRRTPHSTCNRRRMTTMAQNCHNTQQHIINTYVNIAQSMYPLRKSSSNGRPQKSVFTCPPCCHVWVCRIRRHCDFNSNIFLSDSHASVWTANCDYAKYLAWGFHWRVISSRPINIVILFPLWLVHLKNNLKIALI